MTIRYKAVKKATLDSYDYAVSATGINSIDSENLTALWKPKGSAFVFAVVVLQFCLTS
jgi:hypothetical protein